MSTKSKSDFELDKCTSSDDVNIGDSILSSIASLDFNPWKSAVFQWLSNPNPNSTESSPVTLMLYEGGGQPPTDEGGHKPKR